MHTRMRCRSFGTVRMDLDCAILLLRLLGFVYIGSWSHARRLDVVDEADNRRRQRSKILLAHARGLQSLELHWRDVLQRWKIEADTFPLDLVSLSQCRSVCQYIDLNAR